jgi:hypothetical protein
MSLLARYTTPAERRRYCVLAENFERADLVVENIGPARPGAALIRGTPIINFGAILDGVGDYFRLNLTIAEHVFNYANISYVFDFTPYFTPGDGVRTFFFSTGSVENALEVSAAGALVIYIGGVTIASIALGSYLPSWNVNQRTWTPSIPIGYFDLGSIAASFPFAGVLHSVKFFHSLLTADEALDYYNYGAIS